MCSSDLGANPWFMCRGQQRETRPEAGAQDADPLVSLKREPRDRATGVQYRLAGPGQDYATARATLLKMPTMPAPVLLTELLIKLACEAYACLPGASFGMAHRPAKVVPAVMNKATMTSE